jgi:gliding motility-associated-like protein
MTRIKYKLENLIIALSMIVGLLFSCQANATVLGGNITWQCLGGDQYEISLQVYFDCYGAQSPSVTELPYPASLDMIFNSSCAGASSFSAPVGSPVETEISELCPTELINSSCANVLSPTPGVRQVTYTATLTLAAGCVWTIIWNEFNWNLQYMNMTTVFNQRAVIRTIIDTNFPCANSPEILSPAANPAVQYFCLGQTDSFTITPTPVSTANTVSLATAPLTYNTSTGAITNVPGYAAPNGLTLADANSDGTYDVTWTAPLANTGYYILPIEIGVVSGGNVVGTIFHTTTITVRNCNPVPTLFEPVTAADVGPQTTFTDNAVGNDQMSVCAGDSLIFTVEATNFDVALSDFTTRVIDVTSAFNPPAPGLSAMTMTQVGTNPAVTTFKLLTTAAMASSTPYTLQIHAEDDFCPTPGFADLSLNILIKPSVRLFNNDTIICSDAPMSLQATGLPTPNYSWSVTSGDPGAAFTGAAIQNVSPDSTTTYQVTATGIDPACPSLETVTVSVPLHRLAIAVVDESCGTLGGATVTPVGTGAGGFTYVWATTSGSGINAGNPVQTALQGGNPAIDYTVTVTSNTLGCTLDETFGIGETTGPEFNLSFPTTACEGSSVNVTMTFTAGLGPFDVWTSTAPNGALTNADFNNVPSPHVFPINITNTATNTTDFSILLVRDANGCVSELGTVPVPGSITNRPLVTSSLSATSGGTALTAPIEQCVDAPLELVVDHSVNSSFSVVYSINGVDQPALTIADNGVIDVPNPNAAGTFTYDIESVSYLTAPQCPSTDAQNAVTVAVDVVAKPTAAIPAGPVTACSGLSAVIQVTLTGSGPWTIEYTRDGVAQTPISGINSSPYIMTQTVAGTYCITQVTDANCSNPVTGECLDFIINNAPTFVDFTVNSVTSDSAGPVAVDVCPDDPLAIEVNVSNVPAASANSVTYVFADNQSLGFGAENNQSTAYSDNTYIPTTDFTLTLQKIYLSAAPACSTVVNESIEINLNSNISLLSVDTICDAFAETYAIEYTLADGIAPYSAVAGSDAGSFTASAVFTTGSLLSGGIGGTWIFRDIYNCNHLTETDPGYSCPVTTDAGEMSSTPITLCSTTTPGQITATQPATDLYNLDGNDEVMFVLHSDPNAILASEIARACGDASFGDANTPLSFGAASGPNTIVSGTTYYISCVAGNVDVANCVDVTHPNTRFSSTYQAVTWYQTGTAALSAPASTDACSGQTVNLDIDFTGSAPWTFVYSINGTNQPAVTVNLANPYTLNVGQSGTYTLVSLTNSANNCPGTVSGSESVTIHPAPAVTMSADATICGGLQHCFDLNFTAGSAPFTIVVNVPGVTANETVNNLTATAQYCNDDEGVYQILQITDNFGCTATPTVEASIDVYPIANAAWVVSTESYCPNEPAFTAEFITSGDGPFVIDLQGPDPTNPPIITNEEITITAPGDYTLVSIEDTHGCVVALNDIFTAVELVVPTADAGADVSQCAGLPLTIGTPSQPGTNYSWTGTLAIPVGQSAVAQPNLTINNVVNSPYTCTVTVSNGQCSDSDDVVVTIHPVPFVNVTTSDNILCFDAPNNVATLTAVGQPTYTYAWSPSSSILSALDLPVIDVDPSANEVFTLTTSEDFGTVVCSSENDISIFVGAQLEIINLIYPDEMCAGECIDGAEIEFDPLGNFGATTATIDGNDFSVPICFDDPEQHQLLIVDEEGCEATADFTITVRDEEVVMINTDQVYPFCYADNDGTALGYNPEATLYILSENGFNIDVLTQAPFLFQNLTIGTYEVAMNIQLPNGQVCVKDTIFSIEADSPEIFLDVDPPAQLGCFNQEITFTAQPSGGVGNFTTNWFGCPEITPCPLSSGADIDLVLTQDTVVYLFSTDAIGCSSDTISAIGSLSSPPSLLVQNGLDTLETCQYNCEELTAFASGGTGDLSVEWYQLGSATPFVVADTVNRCFVINQIEAFEVRMLDGGCATSLLVDTLWVNVHDTPEPVMDADEPGTCYPDTIRFSYALLDPTYSDATNCVWNLGNGSFIEYCGDTNVVYTAAGEFFPTFTMTSEFGCEAVDTLNNPITIRGYPEVDFTWSPQPIDVLNREVRFQNLTAGADSIYWNFYSAGESTNPNPFWTFPDIETTTPYIVCLTAGNEYGCLDTLCQDIYVENVLQVFIPNTFTPDGDGLNDVFLPIVNGELDGSYRFWVYNRWGDTVFYTEEVGKAWTGGYDGNTYYIPDGYYLWKVQVESLETGKLETYSGNVFIVR